MAINLEPIIETLSNLTVLELNDLRKQLEERWDVKAAPAMQFLQSAAPAAEAAPKKTEFTVVLTAVDADKKLNVIKVIREVKPDVSLMDAKKFVDTLPQNIKEDVSEKEAEECKQKLEAAGAKVELK